MSNSTVPRAEKKCRRRKSNLFQRLLNHFFPYNELLEKSELQVSESGKKYSSENFLSNIWMMEVCSAALWGKRLSLRKQHAQEGLQLAKQSSTYLWLISLWVWKLGILVSGFVIPEVTYSKRKKLPMLTMTDVILDRLVTSWKSEKICILVSKWLEEDLTWG